MSRLPIIVVSTETTSEEDKQRQAFDRVWSHHIATRSPTKRVDFVRAREVLAHLRTFHDEHPKKLCGEIGLEPTDAHKLALRALVGIACAATNSHSRDGNPFEEFLWACGMYNSQEFGERARTMLGSFLEYGDDLIDHLTSTEEKHTERTPA